jgi:hypothetical protein
MIKRWRVEPISSDLEQRRKGPIFPVIVANGKSTVSRLFDELAPDSLEQSEHNPTRTSYAEQDP